MICWPCCLMSTPVCALDSSTTTRPSPSLPRRKSMSRSACVVWPSPFAKLYAPAVTLVFAAAGPEVTGSIATTIELPSIEAVCVTARRRFSTIRERPPDWTT